MKILFPIGTYTIEEYFNLEKKHYMNVRYFYDNILICNIDKLIGV